MCSLVDLIVYELASLADVRGAGFTSRTWGGECLMKDRLRSTPATLGVLQVGPMSTNCRSRCWMGLHYNIHNKNYSDMIIVDEHDNTFQLMMSYARAYVTAAYVSHCDICYARTCQPLCHKHTQHRQNTVTTV